MSFGEPLIRRMEINDLDEILEVEKTVLMFHGPGICSKTSCIT